MDATNALPLDPLTERELEVLAFLAEGLSNREIGERLFLSASTVKWYIRQLNSKLNTTNRDEIVSAAQASGLLSSEPASQLAPNNLPREATPFVGRQQEYEELMQLLEAEETRLITFLAPGGMGKTRLALRAARQQLSSFRDGVFFIDLTAIDSTTAPPAELIASAIAMQLNFQFENDTRLQSQQILEYVEDKVLLLVLDNFEHLLSREAVTFVAELLANAPHLKLIVTSREKLSLLSETVYHLGGLKFSIEPTVEAAVSGDAVQLFVQAAQRAQPDFMLTSGNLALVQQLCSLVEGMPLALLLAAAWLDVLPIEDILNEIRQNLDFLAAHMHDLPERQHSMRAVFDTTWQRLAQQEQDVLAGLSLFRGCTREAAISVAGADLRTLQMLISKALVEPRNGRYYLHERLRQYALETLSANQRHADETLHAFAQYYGNFLEEELASLMGQSQHSIADVVFAELDNIYAAWEHILERCDVNTSERAIRSLSIAFDHRSHYYDAIALWEKTVDLLASAEDQIDRMPLLLRALSTLGWVSIRIGKFNQAKNVLLRAEAIESRMIDIFGNNYERDASRIAALSSTYQRLGDYERAIDVGKVGCERALELQYPRSATHYAINARVLARALVTVGDFDQAQLYLEEALNKLAPVPGPWVRWFQAYLLVVLGLVYFRQGNPIASQTCFEEAHQIEEIAQDWEVLGRSYHYQGVICRANGELSAAQDLFQKSLACYREMKDSYYVANILAELSFNLLSMNQMQEAPQYLKEALTTALRSNAPLPYLTSLTSAAYFLLRTHRYPDVAHAFLILVANHPRY